MAVKTTFINEAVDALTFEQARALNERAHKDIIETIDRSYYHFKRKFETMTGGTLEGFDADEIKQEATTLYLSWRCNFENFDAYAFQSALWRSLQTLKLFESSQFASRFKAQADNNRAIDTGEKENGRKRYTYQINPETIHGQGQKHTSVVVSAFEALDEMSDENCKAVALLLMQGLTVDEIAENFDVPKSTIYTYKSRVKTHLKSYGF